MRLGIWCVVLRPSSYYLFFWGGGGLDLSPLFLLLWESGAGAFWGGGVVFEGGGDAWGGRRVPKCQMPTDRRGAGWLRARRCGWEVTGSFDAC